MYFYTHAFPAAAAFISAACRRMCALRFISCAALYGQWGHAKGRSPVWVRMWLFRLVVLGVTYGQWGQLCNLTLVLRPRDAACWYLYTLGCVLPLAPVWITLWGLSKLNKVCSEKASDAAPLIVTLPGRTAAAKGAPRVTICRDGQGVRGGRVWDGCLSLCMKGLPLKSYYDNCELSGCLEIM